MRTYRCPKTSKAQARHFAQFVAANGLTSEPKPSTNEPLEFLIYGLCALELAAESETRFDCDEIGKVDANIARLESVLTALKLKRALSARKPNRSQDGLLQLSFSVDGLQKAALRVTEARFTASGRIVALNHIERLEAALMDIKTHLA